MEGGRKGGRGGGREEGRGKEGGREDKRETKVYIPIPQSMSTLTQNGNIHLPIV